MRTRRRSQTISQHHSAAGADLSVLMHVVAYDRTPLAGSCCTRQEWARRLVWDEAALPQEWVVLLQAWAVECLLPDTKVDRQVALCPPSISLFSVLSNLSRALLINRNPRFPTPLFLR